MNRLFPLLALVVCFTAGHSQASLVEDVDIAETVRAADTILIGTVDRVEYAADSQTVFTKATLKDVVWIKGPVPERSPIVRLPGGIWKGFVHRLVGYPILELGQRYALCLKNGLGTPSNNYHSIVFWNQGFFPLLRDLVSGKLVAHDAGFHPIVSIDGGHMVVIGRPARLSPRERLALERELKKARPGRQSPDTLRGYKNGIARIVLPAENETSARLDEEAFALELKRLAGQ